MPIERGMLEIVSEAGTGPADGSMHRRAAGLMASRIWQTLVEHHEDVASQRQLDVDRRLRSEHVRIAVQVRAEQHSVFGDPSQRIEAEQLKTARVREDGAVPRHELMEASEFADQLMTGPQEQMIGVGENDPRVEFIGQVALRDALYSCLSAHGHENRGFDGAMCGVKQTGAGVRDGALCLNFKSHYIQY